MLIPVRCFTCGLSLGHLAPVYEYIRTKRMAKKYGSSSQSTPLPSYSTSTAKGEMTDVLDSFKLKDCCRTRLSMAMIFYEHY